MRVQGRRVFILLAVVGIALAVALPAQNATNIRPIQDFIDAQGTYCIPDNGGCFLFVPPVKNFLGWSDPAQNRNASIDYAGLANQYLTGEGVSLGTTFSGTIVERPLHDGRAEVKVVLQTQNALVWVIEGGDWVNDPLLFGYRPVDVINGATPVLCKSTFKFVFINTAFGAPMPDLMQLIVSPEDGQELRFIAMRAQADGPLREAFGVQDGTPGRAIIVENGLFMTPFMGAVADGFPVESIDLKVVGK